jgi:hypothetical protein
VFVFLFVFVSLGARQRVTLFFLFEAYQTYDNTTSGEITHM